MSKRNLTLLTDLYELTMMQGVQMHTGAQLLGQNDAAQRVDAADDTGTFHSIPISFIHFPAAANP